MKCLQTRLMSQPKNSDEFAKLRTGLKRRVVFDKTKRMFREPVDRRPRDLARLSKTRALARKRREELRAKGPQPYPARKSSWPAKLVRVTSTLQ